MGLVGQPTQKATIDIGNRVEDEILKLSELVPVPDEFDVFIAKEGHSGTSFVRPHLFSSNLQSFQIWWMLYNLR